MFFVDRTPVKVITLGNSNAGKTSLVKRYVEKKFRYETVVGLGFNFLTKNVEVDGRFVSMQLWDTIGMERFQAICRTLYKGVDCCVLVYDVTDRKSFELLGSWRDEFLITRCPRDPAYFPFVVLGNKCEMVNRLVSTKEAEQWCQSKPGNITYFDVSAKDDLYVELAFKTIAEKALEQKESEEIDMDPAQPFKLDVHSTQREQGWWARKCCF